MKRFLGVILVLLLSRATFCAAASSEQSAMIQSLIQTLGDPDPAIRDRAGQKLMALGYTARPMLVKAARGPSPQLASRASELLMKLPWWIPADPAAVQQSLIGYGVRDNDARTQAIANISDIPGGEPALLRLVQEEPSESMSWKAVSFLRSLGDDQTFQTLRTLDLTDARVQVLALAGQAFLPVDRDKGTSLLRRAIDEDTDSDGADDEEIDFVYQLATADAIERGKPDEAIALLRTRAERALNADPSGAIFGLMAFRADHQITGGLDADAAEFSAYLGRPEVMYSLARIEQGADNGSNLLADVIGQCARSASLDSSESHIRVGNFCSERAWNTQARQEFLDVLSTEQRDSDAASVENHGFAHFMLARIAEVEEDHLAAADHLEQAVQIAEHYGIPIQRNDGALVMSLEDAKAEIDWHRLHLARASGDTQTADRILQKFIDLPTRDSDCEIEIVGDLKALGRNEEAEACFKKAYLASQLPPPHRWQQSESLNNLAWLCARCGEHTDEAIKLAERALTMSPETYGFIDTAASAYFAAGKPAQAVKLEKRALVMRPSDPFMLRQLQRFEKADTETQRHEDTKQN